MREASKDVMERMLRLEAQVRVLKASALGAVLLAGAIVMTGMTKNKTGALEGDALTIRDKKGVVRVSVIVKDDVPAIGLFDSRGSARLELSLKPDGSPGLVLYDEAEMGRVLLEKGFGDSWSLGFFSEHGEDKARLGVDFRGVPYMNFFGKEGQEIKKLWSAP